MEPSALLLAIITVFLLINSASSQAPDVPFPFQAVPSNQIPPGFKALEPDPPGMSLVLEDPNLPGIQQVVLNQHLPSGFTLVIPNDAESYGYKTKLVRHPPELTTAWINHIGPGLRALSAPPGQLLVFRSPAVENGKGLVGAHPLPGATDTFPINPPQGMTYQPEYVAPLVPPPFEVIPRSTPPPRRMREVVGTRSQQFRVFSDPSKPNILTMFPKIPETMQLIGPRTGPITAVKNVYNVPHPECFGSEDKWNIPPGRIPLPEPGLGEKLVMTDTNNPGIKTIISTPPPGMIYAQLKPCPPNIQWTVMKQSDIDQTQGAAAPASAWDAVGKYEQGGYQPEAAGAVDNIGQDYQATYDNSISNANEFANPEYTGNVLNNEFPSNDNVLPAYPTEERLMELIETDDKVHAKSSAPTQSKIFTRGVLGRDHQKLQIFYGCIVYVIYYLGNE